MMMACGTGMLVEVLVCLFSSVGWPVRWLVDLVRCVFLHVSVLRMLGFFHWVGTYMCHFSHVFSKSLHVRVLSLRVPPDTREVSLPVDVFQALYRGGRWRRNIVTF